MPDTDLGSTLLALARQAIAHHLGRAPRARRARRPAPAREGRELHHADQGRRTARLRIGGLRRSRTLGDDVLANAVAAAMEDPRFPPLEADELDAIAIEVSVLSEPRIPRFLRRGRASPNCAPAKRSDHLLRLPQRHLPAAGVEQLPEPRQFLAALKHKAGLPTNREVVELMAARYHVQKWKETEREAS